MKTRDAFWNSYTWASSLSAGKWLRVFCQVLVSFLELKDLLTKDTTHYTQVNDFSFFLLEDSLTEFQYTGIKRKETEALEIPLHYSCLENPMDRGAWQVTVHRVAKNWTELKRA